MSAHHHKGFCEDLSKAEIEDRLEHSLARLRGHGLRLTPQRRAILRSLIAGAHPTSIETLHQSLPDGRCDLATVYRFLATLEKVGLVRKFFFENGTCLYEFSGHGAMDHHHHHVICRECHQVESLEECDLEAVEETLRRRGYSGLSHMLEFFGVCAECRSKN